MVARIAASFVALVAATVVGATAVPRGGSECNTGPIQCCDEKYDGILGIFGQCSPLNVIGVGGGASCSGTPVCCQNNNVGGLISVGCVPVVLNGL
ncbi:fungal hydrophobin [Trametes sanguinea]|nr:fungal hydrophobin [Trametes sanguinea]